MFSERIVAFMLYGTTIIYMQKAILLTILTLGLVAAVPPQLQPRIEKFDGTLQLDIGKAVQEALKKFDPYFQLWQESDFIPAVRTTYKPSPQQTLTGVVADFNNDKIKDVALFGHNRTHNRILAVLSDSSSNSYNVIEIDKSPLTDPKREWIEGRKGTAAGVWRFLSHVRPGKIDSPYEKQPLMLKGEAFQETYFAKAAVLYYFKDGRFERFTKAD